MSGLSASTTGQWIGIDVGGTKIEGTLVSTGDGVPTVRDTQRRQARAGESNVVADILAVISSLEATARNREDADGPLRGIGIGTPGKVNSALGTVENIANLDVSFLDLSHEIGTVTHLPVHVENDVNAAALGSATLLSAETAGGAATDDVSSNISSDISSDGDADVVAFLNLGTGLAAGILRGGVLDSGFSGVVGEIGHIPVERHRLPCPCGQRGCLETMASGGAVSRMWPQDRPAMPAIIAKSHDVTSPEHAAAQEVRDDVIAAIADAIDILALTVDPRLIIVGGGMSKTGTPLIDEITHVLTLRAQTSPFISSLDLGARLRLAPSDQPVGAVGAALAAVTAAPGVAAARP